jgi:hypothetical protein
MPRASTGASTVRIDAAEGDALLLLFPNILLLGVLCFLCVRGAVLDDSVHNGPPAAAVKLHLLDLLVLELLSGVVVDKLAVVSAACCAAPQAVPSTVTQPSETKAGHMNSGMQRMGLDKQ